MGYHPAPAPYHPPTPAPYTPPKPEPYHAPEPAYAPPKPAYHEPAPYHPPPAPYHPPKPYHEPEPYHEPHCEHFNHYAKTCGYCDKDFPCLAHVPYTKFACAATPFQPGMYVDIEAGCQAYHVCNDGRGGPAGDGFLCPNGTLFNQEKFECDHWYNVDCPAQAKFYELNADPYHNPYIHAEKLRAEKHHPHDPHHPHPAPHHPHPAPHHPAPYHPAPHHPLPAHPAPYHEPAPYVPPVKPEPHYAPAPYHAPEPSYQRPSI